MEMNERKQVPPICHCNLTDLESIYGSLCKLNVFRCVLASLSEGVSVGPSVGPSVGHTGVEFLRNRPNSNKIAPGIRRNAI